MTLIYTRDGRQIIVSRNTDSWRHGRRPRTGYALCGLKDCGKWSDLKRLAKWHFVCLLWKLSDSRCWSDLCNWAWDDSGEVDFPSPAKLEQCRKEG